MFRFCIQCIVLRAQTRWTSSNACAESPSSAQRTKKPEDSWNFTPKTSGLLGKNQKKAWAWFLCRKNIFYEPYLVSTIVSSLVWPDLCGSESHLSQYLNTTLIVILWGLRLCCVSLVSYFKFFWGEIQSVKKNVDQWQYNVDERAFFFQEQ